MKGLLASTQKDIILLIILLIVFLNSIISFPLANNIAREGEIRSRQLSLSITCVGSISQSAYDALYALYSSTNGIHWRYDPFTDPASVWTFPVALSVPCSSGWVGLNCSQSAVSTCDVVGIGLNAMNLTGIIPTQISLLTDLRTLDLSLNDLSGSIPSSVGSLTSLQALLLSTNSLNGTIPTQLGQLTNLNQISVAFNEVGGTLPTELGLLTNILVLEFNANRFAGSIPSEIGAMKSLITLNLDSNFLAHKIPIELSQCANLSTLILGGNYFHGTIPSSILNISSLADLRLNHNNFTGSIPTNLTNLHKLKQLWLQGNRFSSTLSSELMAFENIAYLNVDENYLTGSIPTEIGQLTTLTFFAVNNNWLTGTFPTQIGNIVSMQTLNLYYNYFSGSLPTEFGLLSNMSTLSISVNYLNGPVPIEVCNAVKLIDFDLGFNLFGGEIPTELGQLNELRYLLLEENLFTGTIPTELGLLHKLRYLIFYDNQLTSTIPNQLGNFSDIISLVFSSNLLTGSVPSSIFTLYTLEYLYFSDNQVSGSIPTHIGKMFRLIDLECGNTLFTGSIPSELGNNRFLQYLELYENYFEGTIPSTIGQCSYLNILALGNNYLSGSFPSQLSNLGDLTQLNVSSNSLSGSIVPYSTLSNPILQYVDFSRNQFTGVIPTYVMNSTSLTTVIMYSNCFHGSIPETICIAKNLEVAILDSLTSADSCQLKLGNSAKKFVKGSFPRNLLAGSIPDCMWQMPNLKTLHLAGNGLQGSLGDIPDHSKLEDLSLSYNRLVGSIPLTIQNHPKFYQFDLSFNKLSGTLSDSFIINSNCTNFNLAVNRLSAKLPSAVVHAKEVNILEGNIFTCQEGNPGTLPENDPEFEMYSCGSSNYDKCIILWLIICGFLFLVYFISRSCAGRKFDGNPVLFMYDKVKRYATSFHVLPKGLQAKFTSAFLFLMLRFCMLSTAMGLFYFFFCMISYIILKKGSKSLEALYATYSEQYTWVTTSAYMHGAVPALLICLYLVITVFAMNRAFAFAYVIDYNRQRWYAYNKLTGKVLGSLSTPNSSQRSSAASTEDGHHSHSHSLHENLSRPTGDSTLTSILAGSLSSEPSLSVSDTDANSLNRGDSIRLDNLNNSFLKVHGELAEGSYDWRTWLTRESIVRIIITVVVQFIYASIAVLVNVAYVYLTLSAHISPKGLDWIQFLISIFKLWYNAMVKPWVIHRYLPFLNKSQQLLHMTFMSLFTFIAGPFIATFISHSDCFMYAIFGEKPITSSFTQPEVTCHTLCLESFECVELCDKSKFNSISISTSIAPPWLYSYQCSSALLTNFLPVLVLTFLLSGIVIPTVLYMVNIYRVWRRKRLQAKADARMDNAKDISAPFHTEMAEPIEKKDVMESINESSIGNPMKDDQTHDATPSQTATATGGHAAGIDNVGVDVIGVPTLISKMILNAAVLMTYGLASPLLGITVVIDGMIVSVFWRGYIENYCRISKIDTRETSEQERVLQLGEKLLALERSTASCGAGLRGSITMVVFFLSVFWSLTMVDMFGDVYGNIVGGCCVLLTLSGLPLFHFYLLFWYNKSNVHEDIERRTTLTSIELLSIQLEDSKKSTITFDVELANSEFKC